ncbi:hypothetical protein [Frankia sp. AgB32]|uniref:hypothetical protein n=1 Tax=Frankia sp. AgB32 TaxID=631119 RepID=UPI00200DB381|nr:hypothetical protein [Frankia sp. AgB32]MCK9896206.1 hypothetical protein [Frankia sp. AgB32]
MSRPSIQRKVIIKLLKVLARCRYATGFNHATLWARGRVIDLGTPPGSTGSCSVSYSVAINSAGQVLVSSDEDDSAFLRQAGRRIRIGKPGVATKVCGLTDQGVVAGVTQADGHAHAFRWRAGRLTLLEKVRGNTNQADGITPAGVVVGASPASGTEIPQPTYRPVSPA